MKVVAIGGGTGLSTVLRGLKLHVAEPTRPARFKPYITRLTAVVTVTDEGGSSGRLRREFHVLPPGDIRNCLVALAEDETLFAQLFNYRFTNGRGLRGHSFGNLFLDRKSTRLNSSHQIISYAVFCLKKKKNVQRYCNITINHV